jgi:hypothetical protein
VLERILASEVPHPSGAIENERVRQRIVEEFLAIGITPVVEDALVCSERGSCALIHNIIADIPGRTGGPAVVLNAHYDSVAAAPGAADDGSGVAALLETARVLQKGPMPERPIRFLVDDAEEPGLLGAEAWVRAHSPDETLAVVVLEARGTSGPALLFETHAGNLALIRAYAQAVANPVTSSVFFSVYDRLPNATNFTVLKREGYRGMALAFIEDPARYHTPLDNLGNLSDSSLQHIGDVALSMARELSTNGLAETAGNASYFDLLGLTVVLWPEAWNIGLSVAGLLLVSVTGIVAMRQRRASVTQVFGGLFVVLASLVVAGGAGWLVWRLTMERSGGAAWIASGGLLLASAWLIAAAAVSAPFAFVRRPPEILSVWTSIWMFHGILGVVLSRLLPGGAYLFFIPALAAGLSGLVSLGGRRADRNEGMLLVPFGVSLLLVVPILGGLYTGLGLVALPGIAGLAALLLMPMLAVSTEARRTALLTLGAAFGVIALLGAFFMTSAHSANVPRSLNVVAIHDTAESEVMMVLLGSANVVPEAIKSAAEWSKRPVRALRRSATDAAPQVWRAPLGAVADAAYPDLSGSMIEPSKKGPVLRLMVRPVGAESVIRVRLPEGSRTIDVACGDERHLFEEGASQLVLRGVTTEGVLISASVGEAGEVEVVEERAGLPAAAGRIAALRSAAEVPIGPGDRSIFVGRLSIEELTSVSMPPSAAPASP